MKRHLTIIISVLLFLSINLFGQKKINLEGILIGDKAPEIELPTVKGEDFKLSQLEGKMVLVNFWASWCAPCRRKSPELISIYEKYKEEEFENNENGFEIVYVSLDRNKDTWEQSIIKDSIGDFVNVGDMGGWKCKAAQTYHIKSIPSSLLLDGNGKIIAINLSPKNLSKKLKHLKKDSFFWF